MTLIKNSLLISGVRFFNRGLGLVSTLIVARMLSPDDYGVIAACMLAQDLGYRFSKLGVNQNLISGKDVSKAQLDSLMIQRVVISAAISIVIFAIAPLVAEWLKDSRITDVLRLLCWVFLFNSVINFNCLIETRGNNFKPELISLTVSKVIQVLVTIFCAYHFGNYWALAAGILTASLVQMISSYFVLKPYVITTVSYQLVIKNLSYSKWYVGRELFGYLNAKLAQIVAGIHLTSTLLGYLSVGRDLCLMLALEVSAALDKSNLSYLSGVINEQQGETRSDIILDNISLVFFIKTLVVTPFYLLLFFFPELIIQIILGSGWLEMAPYCKVFACVGGIMTFNTSYETVFDCLRKPSVTLVATATMLIVTLVFSYFAVNWQQPLLLVLCLIVGMLINTLWYIFNIKRLLNTKIRSVLACYKYPMFLILLSLLSLVITEYLNINDVLRVIAFGMCYLIFMLVIGNLFGKRYQVDPFRVFKEKLMKRNG